MVKNALERVNEKIARIFREIADILRDQGFNDGHFKIY